MASSLLRDRPRFWGFTVPYRRAPYMFANAEHHCFWGFKPFPGPNTGNVSTSHFLAPTQHLQGRAHLNTPYCARTYLTSPWQHALWKSRHCLYAHSIHDSYLHYGLWLSMYRFPIVGPGMVVPFTTPNSSTLPHRVSNSQNSYHIDEETQFPN